MKAEDLPIEKAMNRLKSIDKRVLYVIVLRLAEIVVKTAHHKKDVFEIANFNDDVAGIINKVIDVTIENDSLKHYN